MTTIERNPDSPVESISEGDLCYAIIVRSSFDEKGVHFFTKKSDPLQMGSMIHPAGKKILAHMHRQQQRMVHGTHEVLMIRKGELRVDIYRPDKSLVCSRILKENDFILLMNGGHGFEALTELEMIEVKQGPYDGAHDKSHFSSEQDR